MRTAVRVLTVMVACYATSLVTGVGALSAIPWTLGVGAGYALALLIWRRIHR